MGFMNVTIGENCVDVAAQEVVPELVSHAEVLESGAVDVSRVSDSEGIAAAQKHARNALGAGRLGHDLDSEILCERDRVYRKRGDGPLFDDFLRGDHG